MKADGDIEDGTSQSASDSGAARLNRRDKEHVSQ